MLLLSYCRTLLICWSRSRFFHGESQQDYARRQVLCPTAPKSLPRRPDAFCYLRYKPALVGRDDRYKVYCRLHEDPLFPLKSYQRFGLLSDIWLTNSWNITIPLTVRLDAAPASMGLYRTVLATSTTEQPLSLFLSMAFPPPP